MYLAGDLIFCHGGNFISRAIRWAERMPGETVSYANHVAGFVLPGVVVEALWSVVQHSYIEAVNDTPHQIWRRKDLTDDQRAAVGRAAMKYVGREYGVLKIAAHLGDALLSRLRGRDVYLVRRMACLDRYPICSWVWAQAFHSIGLDFGVDPDAAQPDDMHDYVSRSPDWEMIMEIGEGSK